MPMKFENAGCVLDSLELRITLVANTISYHRKPMLHDLMSPVLKGIDPSIQRVPPTWCSNRKGFLGIYMPGALIKCVRHTSNFLGLMVSLENLILGLLKHGFSLTQLLGRLKQFCFARHIQPKLFHFVLPLIKHHLDLYPG